MTITERILAGDRLALARILTLIENQSPEGLEALSALYPHTGKAHIIGITGPPGTGKSTLVNRLVQLLRSPREAGTGEPPMVAVVAVDPSSPFSGGAILGDRIRMRDLAGDPGIFIRSMASRGALGGLARATGAFTQVLDAAGFDLILIETVGAGQAEVDIASAAHTTIVIDAPGLGDDVQANKAGILEIADVLVVNKSDLPGAERTLRTLEMALHLAQFSRDQDEAESWQTPVLAVSALTGDGIPTLVDQIRAHREHLLESGQWVVRERGRARMHLRQELLSVLWADLLERVGEERFQDLVLDVVERRLSPQQALEQMLGD
ncbi:MAG: methylmalonyl Co-A mutase-associated GTPase MeaB [Anaerolineales bacterium]|jgi:LAO/AO transport system kinase